MNINAFLEVTTPLAFGSSILLGLLIGAFYGYMLSHDSPPQWPSALWLVGIAFITVLASVSAFQRAFPFPVELGVGRAILWTVTCASVPTGRYGRHLWDVFWMRRKRQKINDENGNGHANPDV